MDIIKNILYTPNILIKKVFHEKVTDERFVERVYPKISIFSVPGFYFSSPTYIIDNIYLGNVLNASNDSIITKLNITAILNITEEIPNYYGDEINYPGIYNDKINYHTVRIKDINNGDISTEFKGIIDFFNNNKDKNILIHCFMGASRSVIVTILYLIHYHKMTPIDALNYIKDRRNNINPNKLFYDQILEYYFLNY